MKKLQVFVITLLFLITNNIQASFLQGPNPYSFGPQGRSVSDLRDFAKPKSMVRILPNRPVVATDSSGNRVYYTPDGKMTLSIAKNGAMSFSLGGLSKNYNSSGEYSGSIKTLRGSGLLQEVRNKEGEITNYKALNGEGKVSQTFDKDGNLTATYVYTNQGSKLDYVQNEMTLGRSYFDDYGRTMCDVDADGFILATYQYQDVAYEYGEDGKTVTKIDTNGNKGKGLLLTKKTTEQTATGDIVFSTTFFDEEGSVLRTEDSKGFITSEYHYKKDTKGNKIIDFIVDNLTQTKTYFDENGNKDYTIDDLGVVVAKYYDDYTLNVSGTDGAFTVTRYDIDGKELFTTFQNVEYNSDGTIDEVKNVNGELIEKYFYTVNEDGERILDYVINYEDTEYGIKTYTWYDEQGRQMYTTSSSDRPVDDAAANILKDFSWNENTLVYTFDRSSQTTQWYNMDKEVLYKTYNDRVITKNIYSFGQLIGKWDARSETVQVFINERSWITLRMDREPTEDEIRNIISNASLINNKIKESDYHLDDVTLEDINNLVMHFNE
ncbi:MAG: hypothetical protein K5622_02930 [Endomicrobiaceae bacterium]|nr:hypothetical protein [Endomicrobiaceae bacterium]